ncbi:hypothetical protein MAQA_05448 [Listeria aquatica FSL S10-1188]|uniref:RsdA/BaiN/AoA(So)-like insert domain-containing protein n=1 Tax=Listeria aquatica FSL S10-1188 TaxID=1265818 RepID=W7B9N4_9LIST|nr:hypothetical protein MAQA_05448 [Listeria aquatica FSL S10-1188]
MKLDLFPDESSEALKKRIFALLEASPKKALKNALAPLTQEKLLHFLLEKADLDLENSYRQVSPKKLDQFVLSLKNFLFTVNGTLSFDKAFVTGGGVSIKEIDPREMQSKLMLGLFFLR